MQIYQRIYEIPKLGTAVSTQQLWSGFALPEPPGMLVVTGILETAMYIQ